jgi:DNA-binding GntR family transcriptional regulator
MLGFAPASRPKLSEEIAEYLRDQIISGQRRPGERIVLDEVAAELGVSRMPVRDAVLALSHEGLTEVRPRRGVVVAPMTREDVIDAYRVLAFVAGLLAERATSNVTAADLADLRRLQDAMTHHPSTSEEMERLNWAFHRLVNRASHARKLQWLFRANMRNVPQHFYGLIPDWPLLARIQHDELIGALSDGDATRARSVAEQHVLAARSMLVDYLEQRGFWRGRDTPGLAEKGVVDE